MKLPLLVVLLVSACTDFADVSRGVCGNGLLEPGEDCDGEAANCVRCAVSCGSAVDCPTEDYTCGVDGFCHAPGGLLGQPSVPVTFQADDLRITDIDRDGTGDVLGVSKTSIVVRHGDAAGSLASTSSFVTPAQSGPHAFGDLDGDGSIDVTLATLDGIVSYTSKFGTLAPVAIESPIFGDNGMPLNLTTLFSVGQFQLGAFVEDGGTVLLVVVDLFPPGNSYFTTPCLARLGVLDPSRIKRPTIDIYRASPVGALTADFVVSFLTDAGEPCATSIHGSQLAGYTFADITPIAANGMATRPVLADLDSDADPCPSLVNSDGGAAGLRHWDGELAGGHCTLKVGGVDGVVLPPIPNSPSSAVAIGRVPIVPALPPFGSDALAMSSGLYGLAPAFNAFGEFYSSSSRELAYVATGDLDRDGDIDAVLATADQDDLDVLYRFPLGLQLLRVDTASEVTSLTIGDFDGNGVNDIAYTEISTDHQNMMIAYGTSDRPLDPVQVAAFSGVTSVTPFQFPDSVDTLGIAEDLFVIHVDANGGLPTVSLLHGSPQRTMLSFFDPRSENDGAGNSPREDTVLRGAVIGEFTESASDHRDLLAFATPVVGKPLGMRAWRVPGTESGLDPTPNNGIAATGLAACDGTGVCVGDAEYLAWPIAPGRDFVIAIDRQDPTRAALLDPWTSPSAIVKTDIPVLTQSLPAGAVVRSLYAADVDGDADLELVASFASRNGEPVGSVRVCQMTGGVPQRCDDLATVIAEEFPAVTTCVDAAPGRLTRRDPTTTSTVASDLVVLCHEGASTGLYRVAYEGGTVVATPLAHAPGMRSIRVDDLTGDGVDDVAVVQGTGGSQSLVVFAQCSSRELERCRSAADDQRETAAGGAP